VPLPQNKSKYEDQDGYGGMAPRDAALPLTELPAGWTYIFRTQELQFGRFLNLNRIVVFRSRICSGFGIDGARSGDQRPFFSLSGPFFGRPYGLGINLRLAEAGQVFVHGLFAVETNVLGVGANESFVEDAAGKLVEVLLFNRLKITRTDFGDVGNVLERDAFFLARLAEFISEFAHTDTRPVRNGQRLRTTTS
jgi:hypothetical protein